MKQTAPAGSGSGKDAGHKPGNELSSVHVPTLRELSLPIPRVAASTPLQIVERAFREDPSLRAIAVLTDGEAALLTRLRLETMLSGRLGFGRALLTRAHVAEILPSSSPRLLVDQSLRDAAAEVLNSTTQDEDVLVIEPDGTPVGVVASSAIFREVSKVFREIAMRDPLTGLPNRRLLDERGAELVAAGAEPARLGVLYIDLDGFKQVNDTLGHKAGDDLLFLFARRLARTIRPADLVGRLGGDEFAVLLHDVGEQEASRIADRIVEMAQKPFPVQDTQLHISATVGIALGSDLAHDGLLSPLDSLLQQADGAMLHAKRSGKARTGRPSEHDAPAAAPERSALIRQRLPEAIALSRLHLHYQPKLDLRTGLVTSVEALVRWTDEMLGPVSAGELIEVAEQMGQIRALGEWVLRTACAQARTWQDEGRDWAVAINVSPLQLADADLASVVLAAIEQAGIATRLLEVEVTESRAVLDVELASAQMRQLQGAGVHVHLDDFGTGYSSLAMLRRLPVSTLKIDQSIIARIDSDQADAELVAGVINAAHLLGLSVIAEGVERQPQLERLRTLGCDIAQGYLIGRPQASGDLRVETAALSAPR